jgi:hypothetical protein
MFFVQFGGYNVSSLYAASILQESILWISESAENFLK